MIKKRIKSFKKNFKGQTWSMDIIIAIVIFLLILLIVYALLISRPPSEVELRREAERITDRLDKGKTANENCPGIFDGNIINEQDLLALLQKDYQELKSCLGVENDFCIVLTNVHGGLVEVQEQIAAHGKGELIIGVKEDLPVICGPSP